MTSTPIHVAPGTPAPPVADPEALIERMFAASPAPLDPWRAYRHADDRFWPQLIARLRQEIVQ